MLLQWSKEDKNHVIKTAHDRIHENREINVHLTIVGRLGILDDVTCLSICLVVVSASVGIFQPKIGQRRASDGLRVDLVGKEAVEFVDLGHVFHDGHDAINMKVEMTIGGLIANGGIWITEIALHEGIVLLSELGIVEPGIANGGVIHVVHNIVRNGKGNLCSLQNLHDQIFHILHGTPSSRTPLSKAERFSIDSQSLKIIRKYNLGRSRFSNRKTRRKALQFLDGVVWGENTQCESLCTDLSAEAKCTDQMSCMDRDKLPDLPVHLQETS